MHCFLSYLTNPHNSGASSKPNPFLSQTMAIQKGPSYVSESKRFRRIIDITGFADNIVEKNVMRLLLVSTVFTFLNIILRAILEHPPIFIVKSMVMNMIVMPCVACILSVFMVSAVTAVIVFIIWIIVYTFTRSTMTTQLELTTSDRTSFKYITDMIFKLFYVLIVFVVAEIIGFGDNMVERHLFPMRFLLLLAVFTFLFILIPDVLENPPVRLWQSMVLMVMACVVCVIMVLLISTTAAVIVFIFWSVGILTVVVQRWTHIVQEMKAIGNVVAN